MALIKCPECGKEVSNKAKACIHCGYPLEDDSLINSEIENTNNHIVNDNDELEKLIERAYKEVSSDARAEKMFYEQGEQNQKKPISNGTSVVKCPKCGSTQIQMVPRKWSMVTVFLPIRSIGFA